MMTRTELNAPTNVRAFTEAQAMKRGRTAATRNGSASASKGVTTDRFPPVDDVLKNLRLFDRIAAVA